MDSYVDEINPKFKYGDKPRLIMKDTSKWIYLKFDIHRPRWASKTIIGTLMRIWVPETFSAQTITVRRLTQKWREDTIRWNKKPLSTATGASSGSVSAAADSFWEINIDTIVADWIASKAPYGVRLSTAATTNEKMYSSEARAMFRPELLITWSE